MEAIYEFVVCSFVSLSVCLQLKISELAHQFFLMFYMKVDGHKVSGEAQLLKNVLLGQEGLKSPKNGPKMRFLRP